MFIVLQRFIGKHHKIKSKVNKCLSLNVRWKSRTNSDITDPPPPTKKNRPLAPQNRCLYKKKIPFTKGAGIVVSIVIIIIRDIL